MIGILGVADRRRRYEDDLWRTFRLAGIVATDDLHKAPHAERGLEAPNR
jgi:hypothetical protein